MPYARNPTATSALAIIETVNAAVSAPTGRFIFSLNYTDADFAAVTEKLVSAARAMQRDGFWWADAALTNKAIKRRIMLEMLRTRLFGRRAAATSGDEAAPATPAARAPAR